MTSELALIVHGTPAPQGSKTHMGNGVMVEASARVRPWREAVRHAAELAAEQAAWKPPPMVALAVVFTVTRPRSHYRTGRHAHLLRDSAPTQPTGRPDLDKLIRATMDALTDAGAVHDDANVVILYAAKCYPGGHLDALDTPGAAIVLAGIP